MLIIIVANPINRSTFPNFLIIALALDNGTDQHCGSLDYFLEFVRDGWVACVVHVHAFVVGQDDDEEVVDLVQVAVDVLVHGAFWGFCVHSGVSLVYGCDIIMI